MAAFKLHPQLEKDTIELGSFSLCLLHLMNDARYPWFVLVPQRDEITEIYQLEEQDQQQLLRESSLLGAALVQGFEADKLNIAALGNAVPQLHVHHIVRYRNDPVWPAPVWGRLPATPYTDDALIMVVETLKLQLADHVRFTIS